MSRDNSATVIENAGGLDLDAPTAQSLATIPWEGLPQNDPDALSAGDFFEAL